MLYSVEETRKLYKVHDTERNIVPAYLSVTLQRFVHSVELLPQGILQLQVELEGLSRRLGLGPVHLRSGPIWGQCLARGTNSSRSSGRSTHGSSSPSSSTTTIGTTTSTTAATTTAATTTTAC